MEVQFSYKGETVFTREMPFFSQKGDTITITPKGRSYQLKEVQIGHVHNRHFAFKDDGELQTIICNLQD